MNRRDIGASGVDTFAVNAALLLLAVVALPPLAWMLSVSFMPRGEASHFQPPLLPSPHFSWTTTAKFRLPAHRHRGAASLSALVAIACPPRCRCW